MQAQKNLPQPLLVKEARKKRHYLSGNGTRCPQTKQLVEVVSALPYYPTCASRFGPAAATSSGQPEANSLKFSMYRAAIPS